MRWPIRALHSVIIFMPFVSNHFDHDCCWRVIRSRAQAWCCLFCINKRRSAWPDHSSRLRFCYRYVSLDSTRAAQTADRQPCLPVNKRRDRNTHSNKEWKLYIQTTSHYVQFSIFLGCNSYPDCYARSSVTSGKTINTCRGNVCKRWLYMCLVPLWIHLFHIVNDLEKSTVKEID